MRVHHRDRFGALLSRQNLLAGVLLTSTLVVAQQEDRLLISPDEGSLLSDDIYEQVEGWRAPPMIDDAWRPPKPESRVRMHFGYDSAFESRRMRDGGAIDTLPSTLNEPTPNTLFRLEFSPRKRAVP